MKNFVAATYHLPDEPVEWFDQPGKRSDANQHGRLHIRLAPTGSQNADSFLHSLSEVKHPIFVPSE